MPLGRALNQTTRAQGFTVRPVHARFGAWVPEVGRGGRLPASQGVRRALLPRRERRAPRAQARALPSGVAQRCCVLSFVQCIGELRQKLGDDEHRLIKTVSRRGYLLDASVTVPVAQPTWSGLTVNPPGNPSTTATPPGAPIATPRPGESPNRRLWGAAAAAFLCVIAAAAYLLVPLTHPEAKHLSAADVDAASTLPPLASELFTARDAKRVAALADRKQLPVPAFQIRTPDSCHCRRTATDSFIS